MLIMKKFLDNLFESDFWTNREYQTKLLMIIIAVSIVPVIAPAIEELVMVVLIMTSVIGIPITILAIYDGIFKNKKGK